MTNIFQRGSNHQPEVLSMFHGIFFGKLFGRGGGSTLKSAVQVYQEIYNGPDTAYTKVKLRCLMLFLLGELDVQGHK